MQRFWFDYWRDNTGPTADEAIEAVLVAQMGRKTERGGATMKEREAQSDVQWEVSSEMKRQEMKTKWNGYGTD